MCGETAADLHAIFWGTRARRALYGTGSTCRSVARRPRRAVDGEPTAFDVDSRVAGHVTRCRSGPALAVRSTRGAPLRRLARAECLPTAGAASRRCHICRFPLRAPSVPKSGDKPVDKAVENHRAGWLKAHVGGHVSLFGSVAKCTRRRALERAQSLRPIVKSW